MITKRNLLGRIREIESRLNTQLTMLGNAEDRLKQQMDRVVSFIDGYKTETETFIKNYGVVTALRASDNVVCTKDEAIKAILEHLGIELKTMELVASKHVLAVKKEDKNDGKNSRTGKKA